MNANSPALKGPEYIPHDKPNSLVILLHGLGSNGDDLFSLIPYWKDALPETAFLSPHAPYPCDMAPMGYQWFSLREWTEAKMIDGIKTAMPILEQFIADNAKRFNLSYDKIALVGFSQGTMMSLHVAPRLNKKIAGVLGYSGALVGANLLEKEVCQRPPIQLVHGTFDMVVPFAAMNAASHALTDNGFDVDALTCPGVQHSIDNAGLEKGKEFLISVLK